MTIPALSPTDRSKEKPSAQLLKQWPEQLLGKLAVRFPGFPC